MEYKKLGELFKVSSGGTPSKKNNEFYNNGNIPWIKTGDLKTKYIDSASEYITELAVKNSSAKLFPKNTVLIAMYGATIGATSILKIDATTNQACCAFLPNNYIVPEYLYYFFKLNKEKIVQMGVGGAQPNISASILKEIEIPFIDLEKQIRLVNILDKSQELIDKRKEQIEALDELIKSKFIEMFGDPALNPMNWQVVELGSLLRQKASNGFFAKNNEYKIDGNTKVMWLGDIINRRYSNTKGLKSVDATEVQLNKYRVQYGDLLFCRSSLNKDGIGKASAVPKNVDNNIMFECHVIRAPLDLSKCIPEFIQVQSTLDYFRNQIMSNSKTATMTTIGQDGIIATKVILPDIKLQKQFVEIIYQIDKLKFKLEKSLKELEDNFNSLMQKAFKGELFQ